MEGWKASHSSLQGVHVLAVDDDADALTLLREIFESAGAQVTAVDSGAQVLRQIHSARPDVVVTDIAMPSIDGYEMLRRIRSSDDKAVSHVPAIALTAHARSEDRAKASASGFQLHIAKPIDPSELIAAVAALVRRPAND